MNPHRDIVRMLPQKVISESTCEKEQTMSLGLRLAVLVSVAVGFVSGCKSESHDEHKMPGSKMMSEKSLYDRLGGEPAITAVVDDFVGRAAADPKVNFTRKGTGMEWQATAQNVAHVKKMLVQFIAKASGGPQQYEGRDMKSVHKGMKISNAEFNAIAADLKASLDKFKVPAKEQSELLAAVEGTRKDIVELP